jgi:hypothetical protein
MPTEILEQARRTQAVALRRAPRRATRARSQNTRDAELDAMTTTAFHREVEIEITDAKSELSPLRSTN